MNKDDIKNARLSLGDSRLLLKDIPDHSVDLLLTDPPYNIGKHSTGNIKLPGRCALNNDVAEWDLVDFNPEEWCDEFIRVLKPTGNLFIFTTYNQLGRWHATLDHRFDTTQFMIWHKTNPAPKIFKAGFLNSCEMIFCCWNKKHRWNFISQQEMHNFIESPICMRPERLSNPKHPAQKPISVLQKIIRIASESGDVILDPFMGVGSTGVAAIELGRKFIGFEINKEYFVAAEKRILKNQSPEGENRMNGVSVALMIGTMALGVNETKLSPILKWAGGKERELPIICENAPTQFNRFFDPFVGGGSVFMAFPAKEHFINDKSAELISLYQAIKTQNKDAFASLEIINESWKGLLAFVDKHRELCNLYKKFRADEMSSEEIKKKLCNFIDANLLELKNILGKDNIVIEERLRKELERNIVQKFLRMKKIEVEKTRMPEEDIFANVETAFMGSLYMYYRSLYNNVSHITKNGYAVALFVFIRNYAYSGMFRYNAKGEFNVPYGGIGYNKKTLDKKIKYYKSKKVIEHFSSTQIECLDFIDFFKKHPPLEDDFIFLDPPYDSEFSTYAKNEFGKDDQRRLAEYLIHECKGKWQMIIKNTPFVMSLYEGHGLNIRSFDKKYQVSFMNRNDREVEHLIITNY